MKLHPSNPLQVTLFYIILILSSSCNKDSDLLAEYVIENPEIALSETIVTLRNSSVTIKPSGKYSNGNSKKSTITDVSTPSIGTAVINDDNSITYTPDTDITGTDEFNYTTDITNTDNTITQETGSITVTIADDETPISSEPGDMGELKAFPGAEGFGKNAIGGRGGKIVEVTTTNFSGPGSLKEALEMKGARTIIFRVGGTISNTGSSYLTIPMGSGNVTIAGETAPGNGISIRGAKLSIRDSNVIIRHLRFRQDPSNSTGGNDDAMTIDGTQSDKPLTDIIIDHCSFSGGLDGNLDIRNTWGATVQNSIFSHNEKSNLINANSKDISYIKNIFALVRERTIRANTIDHLDLTYEQINCLLYAISSPGGPSHGLKVTIENNICENSNEVRIGSDQIVEFPAPNPDNGETNKIENTYLYVNGNDLGSVYKYDIKPTSEMYRKNVPLYRSDYTPLPTAGLKNLLLTNAGAYNGLRQGVDAIDQGIFNNITNKNGTISQTYTFPSISNGTPYLDSDGDGMDDNWETVNNLNPNDNSDGQKDRNGDGYTNLEEFLYSLTLKK